MTGLAQRADAGPWESIWVYDHFHTTPDADRRGDARGVDADGRVRGRRPAGSGSARCAPACAYRNPAYLAKVAATVDIISGGRVEMGIGAGWYEHEWRAYGYGFPPAPERLAPLDEGVQIMHQAWTDRLGDACRARTTRSTARSSGRCRCSRAASRSGSPAAARRSRCGSPRKYAQYTNFDGTPEGFRHKSEVLRRALPATRPRLRRDHPLGQLQRRDRPGREGGRRTGCLDPRPTSTPLDRRREGRQADRSARCAGCPGSAPRSRSSRSSRALKADGPRLRHHLLPRARLRPQRHRAVRAGGHPRARGRYPVNPRWPRGWATGVWRHARRHRRSRSHRPLHLARARPPRTRRRGGRPRYRARAGRAVAPGRGDAVPPPARVPVAGRRRAAGRSARRARRRCSRRAPSPRCSRTSRSGCSGCGVGA